MAELNQVLLLGNTTRNPDVRYTREGRAVCSFGMAVNHHYRTRGGDDRQDVCFVDVEAFGEVAEDCARHGGKGILVLVDGHLRMKQWTDRRTGKQKSKLLVTADFVQHLPR
ncbi:MAG: single-stranded DNA-binding protein [Verrucomicrobiota bacterium]